MAEAIRGYKVFNSNWTCRDKQYTCPGIFEEDVTLSVCCSGMHFCKKVIDCFNYYEFDPRNHVAEVVGCGNILEGNGKYCTDKLEIVREIPWSELLEIVNIGENNTGIGNVGDLNSGNKNTGHSNSGNFNTGCLNSGCLNTGCYNMGDRNSGNTNSGNGNTGDCNIGNLNTGNWNNGDLNTGDWNTCCCSSGCFNTVSPPFFMFNKPSNWSYAKWLWSDACDLFSKISKRDVEFVDYSSMTDEEKRKYPEAKEKGGYLRKIDVSTRAIEWWKHLSRKEKKIIMEIPNFDKDIFKEITGIDVDKD